MSRKKFTPLKKLRGNVEIMVYTSKFISEKDDDSKVSEQYSEIIKSILGKDISVQPINFPPSNEDGISFGNMVYYFNLGNDLYKSEIYFEDGSLDDELSYCFEGNKLIENSERWNETFNVTYHNPETNLIEYTECGAMGHTGSYYSSLKYEYDDNHRVVSETISECERENVKDGYWDLIGDLKEEFEYIILFSYLTKDRLRKRYYTKEGIIFDEYIDFDGFGFLFRREVFIVKDGLKLSHTNIPFIKEYVSNFENVESRKICNEFYDFNHFDNVGNWLNLSIERNFFKDSGSDNNYQDKILITRKITYHK